MVCKFRAPRKSKLYITANTPPEDARCEQKV